MATIDDIRAGLPMLGVAVYALEPGGPVTLEIHAPNEEGGTDIFTWVAMSEAEAIDLAFLPPPPRAQPTVFD